MRRWGEDNRSGRGVDKSGRQRESVKAGRCLGRRRSVLGRPLHHAMRGPPPPLCGRGSPTAGAGALDNLSRETGEGDRRQMVVGAAPGPIFGIWEEDANAGGAAASRPRLPHPSCATDLAVRETLPSPRRGRAGDWGIEAQVIEERSISPSAATQGRSAPDGESWDP